MVFRRSKQVSIQFCIVVVCCQMPDESFDQVTSTITWVSVPVVCVLLRYIRAENMKNMVWRTWHSPDLAHAHLLCFQQGLSPDQWRVPEMLNSHIPHFTFPIDPHLPPTIYPYHDAAICWRQSVAHCQAQFLVSVQKPRKCKEERTA